MKHPVYENYIFFEELDAKWNTLMAILQCSIFVAPNADKFHNYCDAFIHSKFRSNNTKDLTEKCHHFSLVQPEMKIVPLDSKGSSDLPQLRRREFGLSVYMPPLPPIILVSARNLFGFCLSYKQRR